ncbi:Phosphatidylglycerol phospholipase C [Lachnellula hyalina]|uniref:Phosphatidylglycerol phospholipase C n=1 Tax=Lachnellula hyalina TaxID=1316788 RepID=A0A8H8RA69_9HELO|nr:Phosphatidylglycerol phospholipase C [Lachnellula hyalina]TVY31196.1 Phosphatidylglycerol phospholipase C [Lachnellula hyalina]
MAESDHLLQEKMESPAFTSAKRTPRGRPQAIAHRGYKAAHPENTMGAFKGAVEVGAHAIETDLHLSKDGVVVLCHDATLKRCFGTDEKIVDCDWEYLKTLRTLEEPHEPMPRFKDLLEYLVSPGLEDIWVLLDVKLPWPKLSSPFKRRQVDHQNTDDQASKLFKAIAATLEEVKPSRPWTERILIGCWAAKYLPLCSKHLPKYPIVHIGASISYARQFLKVPRVSLNMLLMVMVGPRGNALIRDARKANRSVFLWTVNEEPWMKWSIKKGVDGVVTDDPKKYLEICKTYEGEKIHHSLRSLLFLFSVNVLVPLFSTVFRYNYGFNVDLRKFRKGLESSTTMAAA